VLNYKQLQFYQKYNTYLFLALVIFFSSLVRLGYFIWASQNSAFFLSPIVDAAHYHQWALKIYNGNWFSNEPFYQAPLFPYFLALVYRIFGADPVSIYIVHSIMGLVNILLVFKIAQHSTSTLWATIAALFFSLYPGFVFYENNILSETLSIHLFLWSLLLTIKATHNHKLTAWLWPGIIIGLSALAKPNMLLLLVFISMWLIIIGRKNFRQACFKVIYLVTAALFIISPATLHNWIAGNEFSLISTNGAMTFVHGNNPSAKGTLAIPSGFTGNIETQRDEEIAIASKLSNTPLNHKQARHYWFTNSIHFLFEHPRFALHLELKKLWRLIGNYEYASNYNIHYDLNFFKVFMPLPFALLFAFGVLGLINSNWKKTTTQISILFLLVPCITVMIFYMTSRYRLPVVPILIIFSAVGLNSLITQIKQSKWSHVTESVLILAFLITISFWPIEQRNFEAKQFISEGVALMNQGNNHHALLLFKKAEQSNSLERGLWNNMGNTLRKLGRSVEALDAYKKALDVPTDRETALQLLGIVNAELYNYAESEKYLLLAQHENPSSAQVQLYLAMLYYKTNQVEKAKVKLNKSKELGLLPPEELSSAINKRLNH